MNEQARNINALLDKYNNTKQANKNKAELNNIKLMNPINPRIILIRLKKMIAFLQCT